MGNVWKMKTTIDWFMCEYKKDGYNLTEQPLREVFLLFIKFLERLNETSLKLSKNNNLICLLSYCYEL